MRSIVTALSLVALCSPAFGQDCRFFNEAGQSLEYRPTAGEIIFDPLYDDAVVCDFIREIRGNEWALECEDVARTVVVGSSEPKKPFADILVFNGIFYWLKCEETT